MTARDASRLQPFSLVYLLADGPELTYSLRDRTWDADEQPVLHLRDPDGRLVLAAPGDVEVAGGFEAPYQYHEVVRIARAVPGLCVNDLVVVAGIAAPCETEDWGFDVRTASGQLVSVAAADLASTGRFLRPEHVVGTRLRREVARGCSSEEGRAAREILQVKPAPYNLSNLEAFSQSPPEDPLTTPGPVDDPGLADH